MKQLMMKLSLAAAMLLCASVAVNAQSKFGYINSQEIIMAMPEVTEVQAQLEKMQKDLEEQLEIITVEYNNKAAEYQKNAATYTDAIRQSKERELTGLQQRYEELGQAGSKDVQAKQAELMKPVIDKARAAINKVAAAGKYTFIFDQATGAVAYFDEAQVTNLAPQVKTELGIK